MITIPKIAPIDNMCLHFNGTTDYLIKEDFNDMPASEFTFETWIKTDSQKAGTIISYSIANGVKNLSIENIGNIRIYINNIQTVSTGIALNDGEWHHFAVTWKSTSGELILYVDAAIMFQSILAQNTPMAANGCFVCGQLQTVVGGGFSPNTALEGEISYMRFWNRARTPYYIKQDMTRTLGSDLSTVIWQQPNSYHNFTNVSGAKGIIYAINEENIVQRSKNFGVSWETTQSPQLVQVSVAGANTNGDETATGVDSNGNVWLTLDSGNTWTTPDPNARKKQVDAIIGLAIGCNNNNNVWTSTNNGIKWDPLKIKLSWGTVATNVYWGIGVDTNDGKLYKSTNSGTSWTAVTMPDNTVKFTKLSYIPGTLAALGTDGILYITYNDGSNWEMLNSNLDLRFNDMTLVDNLIFALDYDHQLLMAELDTHMVMNWRMIEGYGNVAFDYSDHHNFGILGSPNENGQPEWLISSYLPPPSFIRDNGVHFSPVGFGMNKLPIEPAEMVGEILPQKPARKPGKKTVKKSRTTRKKK